jgi:hypothetical protein
MTVSRLTILPLRVNTYNVAELHRAMIVQVAGAICMSKGPRCNAHTLNEFMAKATPTGPTPIYSMHAPDSTSGHVQSQD